jgi:UDP-N-acetylmuramyl pentapeptide phosphotransferase/UDP-N-acetylglucosamine-1-phosphate transferase
MTILGLAFATFTLSLLSVFFIKQRYQQYLLDIPNDRSSHTIPTPRGGGLGFVIAFLGTIGIFWGAFGEFINPFNLNLQTLSGIQLTLIPLGLVGFFDDQGHVPARIRYMVQLGAAAIAILFFGALPQPWLVTWGIWGNVWALVLTLIGFTAMINFYNFMDGLDGLVGSVTALQLGFIALYCDQPMWWLLVAAVVGFLYWNWSPAKIFMGDVGSTVLGASVGIALLNSQNSTSETWAALGITLPLIGDAIYTLSRRLLNGENIFQAHRTHLYQRLQQSGWSHAQVSLSYLGATAVIALLIFSWDLVGSGLSLMGVVVAIVLGEFHLQRQSSQGNLREENLGE